MFGKINEIQINMLETIDVKKYPWCNEALLFEVKNGKGALKWKTQNAKDDFYDNRYYCELMLNNVPILQKNKTECPTCASLIAVGYGIENADCKELQDLSDHINAEYDDLLNAFNITKPLLGLLQDGLYVLADCSVFPSDGNGHFFWGVPNEFVENPTTAYILTEEYDCISGIPAFLYPSQGTDKFNPKRVDYYKSLLADKKKFPRAIAYFSDELLSVLLDGHHKAAACACLGLKLPCLVIMPHSGVSYKQPTTKKMIIDKVFFGEIGIDAAKLSKRQLDNIEDGFDSRQQSAVNLKNYGIIKKEWENHFSYSYSIYPDAIDYAESVALDSPPITSELIEKCIAAPTEDNLRILRYAVQYLFRTEKDESAKLALRVAKLDLDPKLTLTAFKILALFKENPEIEQFFIDHLIEDSDPHSALKMIADSYWDN